MPIQYINGLPPLPFPAIPTAYDESLSFMELVTKLWNSIAEIITVCNANSDAITTITAAIETINAALENVPSEQDVQQLQTDVAALQLTAGTLTDGLTQEIENRQNADTLIQSTLTAMINDIALNYVSTNDLEHDYLVGGVTFQILTQAQYDALTEYTPLRVYFVIGDSDHMTIKYGGSSVGGGSIAGNFVNTMKNANRGGVIPFTPDE